MYTERFPLEFLRTEVWFTGQNYADKDRRQ